MRILNVCIKHTVDTDPDTSWLGEYTDELKPGVIVREHNQYYEKLPAPMERDTDGRFYCKGAPEVPSRGREFRGFKPYAGGEKEGTKDYYKYGMQDYQRMEGLNKGDWYFIGVTASAQIQLNSDIVQKVHSGGLWGIESDCGEGYIKEVEDEELSSLRKELEAIGFPASDIDEAYTKVTRKD